MRKIAILGSTGSIGTQTLDVISQCGGIEVKVLACSKNISLLEEQIRIFHPKMAAVFDEKAAEDLRVRVRDCDVTVVSGMEGLLAAATYPTTDMVVTALVGMIGIRPTLSAIEAGKDVALANKETLVCAGHLIMPKAKERGVRVLPVDSEHSAIFQSLLGAAPNRPKKILLTASGGPFRGRKREELSGVTPKEALSHPTWHMGPKVTIDSSTLVNKGLEIMEAHWLFDVPPEEISVLIHPQSILHSAVQFFDGAVIGQMAVADMRLPIAFALYYPNRTKEVAGPLDLCKVGNLTFEEPDRETFSALPLAYRAAERGGSLPTVYNAADECAVSLFLEGKIRYLDIPDLIADAMESVDFLPNPDLDEIEETEEETRRRLLGQARRLRFDEGRF